MTQVVQILYRSRTSATPQVGVSPLGEGKIADEHDHEGVCISQPTTRAVGEARGGCRGLGAAAAR